MYIHSILPTLTGETRANVVFLVLHWSITGVMWNSCIMMCKHTSIHSILSTLTGELRVNIVSLLLHCQSQDLRPFFSYSPFSPV